MEKTICEKTRLSAFDGQFFQVVHDGEFETLGKLTNDLSVPYLSYVQDEQYLGLACKNKQISCLLCTKEIAENEVLQKSGKGIAVCDSPESSFFLFYNWLAKKDFFNYSLEETEIGEHSTISTSAVISETGVKIGTNVVIEENVIIRAGVTIGDNVIISTGAVIGVDNINVSTNEQGEQFLVSQIGRVRIGNNVKIGCYSCIGRGMFPYEETVIDDNTCIDCNVVIAHNSQIGKNVVIFAQAQICGNAVIEDRVRVSPCAVVSNRLTIKQNAKIEIGAVVVNNVKKGMKVAGNFAIEHSKFLLWHRKKLRKL